MVVCFAFNPLDGDKTIIGLDAKQTAADDENLASENEEVSQATDACC